MNILWILHPSVLSEGAVSIRIEKCMSDIRRELDPFGIYCTSFDSRLHKVKDFDLIHIFSKDDPETWQVIQKMAKPVIVSPSLSLFSLVDTPKQPNTELSFSVPPFFKYIAYRSIFFLKRLKRWRWGYLSQVDRFICSESDVSFLRKNWKLRLSEFDLLIGGLQNRASQLVKVYRQYGLATKEALR